MVDYLQTIRISTNATGNFLRVCGPKMVTTATTTMVDYLQTIFIGDEINWWVFPEVTIIKWSSITIR